MNAAEAAPAGTGPEVAPAPAALAVPPLDDARAHAKFVTRAKTLFYSRLAFLTLGLGVLGVRSWAAVFGVSSGLRFVVALAIYFAMLLYSVANFLVVERPKVGRAVTFVTLCFDLTVVVYLIVSSGGLNSPLLATQLMFTTLFLIVFPKPLAILPPLLTLPIIARIDQLLGGKPTPADVFTVLWFSAINVILVYAIVYLNQREETQQRELSALHGELRKTAVVEERNRLAREIHDGLGAALSSLIIQAEYLEQIAGGDAEQLRGEIRELKGAAEESIDELRRSLKMMKEDFDLVPAVEDHCRTFADRSRLEVRFTREGKERPMSAESALTIFRTLQESLANAQKHGAAKRVDVRLAFELDHLALTVKDDGRGFDTGQKKPGHYGLINMRERARKVGGTVYVESEPGGGALIALEIPYATGQSGMWRMPKGA